MIYDVKKERLVSQHPTGGSVGQISYKRLIAILRSVREIHDKEDITYLEFNDCGIKYGVETKNGK